MLLCAASNIIIMEYLESKYRTTLSFKEFVKAGALAILINTLIYYPFLLLISLRVKPRDCCEHGKRDDYEPLLE